MPIRSERFVPRPRLNRLLDEATTKPLTIVTGPAGVGKTLAVADWSREGHPPGPVVWVNVGEDDRGAEQLWTTLALALTEQLGEDALIGVGITHGVASMLAGMASNAGGTIVLVLDGCEKLSGGSALGAIDQILSQPVPGLRLVMLSRHDPALALHRLRLADQLAEVRFRDLAFVADEARLLLGRWDVHLHDVALAKLLESTEGWAAALRLTAFSLSRAEDPDALLSSFDGVNFLVSEYLWDEVLAALPEDVREFLQLTAISERLCGQLGSALSGNASSHAVLRMLAHEELLVQELNEYGWYRTHPLLSRVLLRRLRDERPELEVEGHRRAALWFEDQDDAVTAIRHAVQTGDREFMGTIAVRSAASVVFSTDRASLAASLSHAPPPLAHDQGELAVAQALGRSLVDHDEGAGAMVERAEMLLTTIAQERRPLSTVALRVAQAFHAHYRGDARAAETASNRADELLAGISASDAHSWAAARPRVAMMQVGATLWAGNPAGAGRLSHRPSAGQPPEHPTSYSPTYRLGLLAFMEAVQEGRITEAHGKALRALDLAIPDGRLRSTESQLAWLALGLTELAHGNIAAARTHLDHAGQATALNPNPHIAGVISITRGRAALAVGEVQAARGHLAGARALIAQYPGMLLVSHLAAAAQVSIELGCGSVTAARDILTSHCTAGTPTLDALVLAHGQVLLAEGAIGRARHAVEPLLTTPGVLSTSAWLVVSRVEDRLRHDALSIEACARALEVAASQGLMQPFLHPPAWLTSFLRRHAHVVGTHHDFVQRALALEPMSPAPGAQAQVGIAEPSLTERELAVLLHLPTMSSNTEIATALSISANTVKQHLKSSYRKLGVGTRRDAVRVARDRGLLSN